MKRELDLENDLKNGPVRDRSTTDFICCIIFLAFWAACVFVAIFALQNGDPVKLIQTFDINGKACGSLIDGTLNYPLGYFYQPLNNLSYVVCVSSCPNWNVGNSVPTSVDCYGANTSVTTNIKNCQNSNYFDFASLPNSLAINALQPFLIYNTTSFLNKFCIPNISDLTGSALATAQSISAVNDISGIAQKIISDIQTSWRYIALIAGISLIVSLLFLLCIRWLAGIMVWLLILGFLVGLFLLGYLCQLESNQLATNEALTGVVSTSNLYNPQTMHILSIVFYVIGGICTVGVLFCVSSISLAIAVLKTAAMFIYSNLLIILTPIFHALLIFLLIIYWIAIMTYLWTIGTQVRSTTSPFVSFTWDQKTTYLAIFHIFSLLWNIAFIKYLSVFIVGCTCSIWYFNQAKDEVSLFRFPILTSYWWSFRYHLGSLGLGSFLLAVIWMIQLILLYILHYVEELKKKGVESKVVETLIKILMCCVSCFESFVQFISAKGFIQIAVTSRNFCRSCLDAFLLILQNPLRFGLVDSLALIFVYIGKLFVATGAGILGYILMEKEIFSLTGLNSKFIPIIIFIVLGYFIANFFFSVYGDAADTVILCFFLDKELAKKSDRPIEAPGPMQEFYEKFKNDD